jgi:hypothetical protein
MPNTSEADKASEAVAAKQAWEPPRLTYLGHINEIVQGGTGKLSPSTADPGDIRKPSGLDKQ